MKRMTSIEFLRIYAALSIAFLHFDQFLGTKNPLSSKAYIWVEFFLMVTGFFMMKGILENNGDKPLKNPLAYTLGKAKAIWGIYAFSFFFTFAIREITSGKATLKVVLSELWHFKWEFLMLHMAGFTPNPQFNTDYLNPPAWYLSSLLLGVLLVYPLAVRLREKFCTTVAPLFMLAVYCFFMQSYKTMDAGNQIVLCTMAGNLRAVAGLCGGALSYHCFTVAKNRKTNKTTQDILNIASWLSIPCLTIFCRHIPEPDMLVYVVVFLLILIQCAANEGPISRFLNSHGNTVLASCGSYSIAVYLLHFGIILIWRKWLPSFIGKAGHITYLVVLIAFSVLVLRLGQAIKKKILRQAS